MADLQVFPTLSSLIRVKESDVSLTVTPVLGAAISVVKESSQVELTRPITGLVTLAKSEPQIEVSNTLTSVVTLTAPGPQGPPFVGSVLFDTQAIEALTLADTGTVLEWDGARFSPTNELENNLTLNGGSF
jgi:hypothetical protein